MSRTVRRGGDPKVGALKEGVEVEGRQRVPTSGPVGNNQGSPDGVKWSRSCFGGVTILDW